MVLEPGHMYMGFYVDANKTEAAYIETTLVGDVDLRDIYESDGVTHGLGTYLVAIGQLQLDG